MAITVKHKFVSAIPDAGDPTIVQPSNWNDDHDLTGTIPVANGGTGASTLTGYVIGNGTAAMTASTTIPSTAVTGLGTMSTQNANNVAITGGTMSGVTVTGYIPTTEKAVANGVATLDGSGTVPISQLPAAVLGALSYQGTWNASTNTPTLTSSVGTKGYYYVVSVAGSTNLNGITDWQVGDWAVFNGSVWQKVDNTDAVTSVNGYTGTVVLGYGDITTGVVPVVNGGTGVTVSSGANSVVLRDANVNINANALDDGYSNIAASGTPIVLTTASVRRFTITGSGGQTIKLPDATTLTSGAIFQFDNNQSSGAITVNNNSNTLIVSVPSGGFVLVNLLSNATAAGSWDRHDQAPSNVSWSTNTFDYAGSFTSGTWNGNAVAYNRGGTGQSSAFTAGGIVYGSTTSALAVTSIGTTGQVLTSAGAGTPTWTTPTTGTVTSVAATAGTGISVSGSPITTSGTLTITNTAPDQTVVLTAGTGISTSGTYPNFTITNTSPSSGGTVTSVTGTAPVVSSGGNTPAISMPVATTSVSGYLSSTDWTTFNNKSNTNGTVTSVAALTLGTTGTDLSSTVATGTTTPVITLQVPTASATNRGALSAADWTTFNNKGSGSVTSVALTAPSIFTVTGSPVTSSGTLALTYSGTALPILNGGTGQTTANAAFNALAPSQTSNSGKYLTTDGTNTSWATVSSNAYTRTSFTATAGQTTFTVSYTVGLIQVYVNGVMLNGADYTASNGTSVVLAVGRATNDIVETVAFNSFAVANTVSSFSGGTTGLTPSSASTGIVTLGGTLAVANGGTGVTTSTGSGSVVLGTSPTIATPTITSLYGQNSNLVSTPYNGTGLIPAELVYRLNTAYVGSNVSTVQSLLGVGVTVVASTQYQFDGVFMLNKVAGTTSHTLSIGFGGTATLNNIGYFAQEGDNSTSQTTVMSGSQPNSYAFLSASQTVVMGARTTAGLIVYVIVKGTVSINAGGTFIPQYQLSATPGGAYTTQIGSYFKLSPMSASGSNTSIGTWA